jgi:hypothetical protein
MTDQKPDRIGEIERTVSTYDECYCHEYTKLRADVEYLVELVRKADALAAVAKKLSRPESLSLTQTDDYLLELEGVYAAYQHSRREGNDGQADKGSQR